MVTIARHEIWVDLFVLDMVNYDVILVYGLVNLLSCFPRLLCYNCDLSYTECVKDNMEVCFLFGSHESYIFTLGSSLG